MKSTSKNVDLLRGRYQEIPNVRSKIVRIFVSSTFSDTLCERDSLIESVFPKLKDYCREKYGLEFQYSDMRWGIQTESSDNHSEVQTCLKEIELCQKYSLATNFVVLLSHRYGSRPTPSQIRAPLFERLHQMVSSDPARADDAELLSRWYRLDTNCIPAAYILRPISLLFPDIRSSDTNAMKKADKAWKKENERIRTCLRAAAATCLEQGEISQDDYDDFFISVTEKEIVKGILAAPNANERTLCFIREIDHITEHITDQKADKFIDLVSTHNGNRSIDREAEQLLNRLKYERIPQVLQPENIFSYTVPWKSGGISRTHHAEYLSKFQDDFYDAMKHQIDRCIRSRLSKIADQLENEILEHAIQCKTYVSKFHGRTDILEHLEAYIKHPDENRPCIVYGESGCGKTSVMAKAAMEAKNWWSDRSYSVILRFLGTTPNSSTGYKMMLSLSQHISKLYNLPMIIYPDILQLRHQLETTLLPNIPKDEHLIILLDSIDQLDWDSYTCRWLPDVFPKNVKCIVSTLPKHGMILTFLHMKINYDEKQAEQTKHLLINVLPFQPSTVEAVYRDWLAMKSRALSEEQQTFIGKMMEKTTTILPLFMKLIFDIISTWHSYDPIPSEFEKLKSVDDCIRYLFNYLMTIHNPLLFRRAICYMTASRNGISQNELEDVLSLDDEVLHSVFEHFIPPVRRLPGILWTRIRNDLDEYITEKEADDSPVMYWYHRRFIEVANSQFISKMNSSERMEVFRNIVDYYNETWKGKNKPFKIRNEKLVQKYNLQESSGEIVANRLSASQPIEFADANGCIQYNKRKLNELPAFITQLSANIAIPLAAEVIFFNYPFMRAKLACSTFNDIFDDLSKIKQSSSYKLSEEATSNRKELDIYASVYLICGGLLQNYPDNFPFEFSARLLYLYGIRTFTTRLIQAFDKQGIRYCSLIVPYAQVQPPGSGLIYSMNRHTSAVVDLDFTDDQMVAISLSDRIVVIDMREAQTVLDLNLPILDEPYLNATTLPELMNSANNQDNSSTESENKHAMFKNYLFLVNSHHHIYFLSGHESIRFERSSKMGFTAVEVFDRKRGLAVIAEKSGHYVDCLDLMKNSSLDRLNFSESPVKAVLCAKALSILVTVLENGTIYLHAILDWQNPKFVHLTTLQMGKHLDLVSLNESLLIFTFDSTVPLDFALLDLKLVDKEETNLTDANIPKVLLKFDPPIDPKPIRDIILPNKEAQDRKNSDDTLLFMAKTDDAVYVIHRCNDEGISYAKVNGRFDVVSMNTNHPKSLYTSRGGMVQLHKWSCVKNDDSTYSHKYELYVSIDISSSPVTSIQPASMDEHMVVCANENGGIQVYHASQARMALQKVPMFPRTTEVISSIQLCAKTAVTLDAGRRELTAWSYQHATGIHSKYTFGDHATIKEFALTASPTNPNLIFVLVITNLHWAHIYSAKSLNQDPVFSFHVRSPSRVHASHHGSFFLLTNNATVYCISENSATIGSIEFTQTATARFKFACSMMLSTLVTLQKVTTLIALADNGQSMGLWFQGKLIYVDLDLSPYFSSYQLNSITSDPLSNVFVLYFQDKTLISCQVKLNKAQEHASVNMTPFDKADMFCLKRNCLAVYNKGKRHLDLHNIENVLCLEPIQLENECLRLCLNESAEYAFALVKPRVLFMYRIEDRRQLAKLFVFDFVTCMVADQDFIALAMNDRRLLTLMIADPDDLSVETKIKSLPSRNLSSEVQSKNTKLAEHMEKCAEWSSSDEDSDDDEANDDLSSTPFGAAMNPKESPAPTTFYQYVTRLNGRRPSQSKMIGFKEYSEITSKIYSTEERTAVIANLNNDVHEEEANPSDDDADVAFSTAPVQAKEHENIERDLNDIRQKTIEHDRQQLKGVQLANAGDGNLKVVNSYAVTSSTCNLI